LAKFNHVIGVRLSDEHVTKLDRLAETTYRGRGDILRCLIDLAEAVESPGLAIRSGAEVEEGAHVPCGAS
jgi:predicted transcriptional regulator